MKARFASLLLLYDFLYPIMPSFDSTFANEKQKTEGRNMLNDLVVVVTGCTRDWQWH